MNKYKQQGKGLFSFLAGCVAAVVAIAGVLLTLNMSSSRDFKQPELNNRATMSSEPQVLTPLGTSAPNFDTTQASGGESSAQLAETEPLMENATLTNNNHLSTANQAVSSESEALATPPVAKTRPEPQTESQQIANVQDDPVLGDAVNTPVVAATKVVPHSTKTRETAKQPEKRETRREARRRQQEEDLADNQAKPTAEQILNSGNIEKAREAARREAREKRAQQRAAEAAKRQSEQALAKVNTSETQPEKVAPQASNKTATTQGKVSLQAGAYNKREMADMQRARLAQLGVRTEVVEAKTPQGKTVYRVQTQTLDGKRADQVRQKLNENGVNTFTHKQ